MQNDWIILGEYPIPWFHTCYMDGLAIELKQHTGFGLSVFVSDYHDGGQRMYGLQTEWQKAGEGYFHKIQKDPHVLERDLDIVVNDAQAVEKYAKTLRNKNASALSDAELLTELKKLHAVKHPLWSHGMVPNLLEWNQGYLSGYLTKKFRAINPSLTAEDIRALITSTHLSWLQKAERDLFALASRVQIHDNMLVAVKDYHEQYAWTEYGWTGPLPALQDFASRLEILVKEGNSADQLRDVLAADNRQQKRQLELEESINLSQHDRLLLQLLRRVLFEKTIRVDAFYQGYSAFEPYLKELAKRHHVTVAQISMLYIGDLITALESGSLDVHLLNNAQKFSARILEHDRLVYKVGEEARKKIQPVLDSLPRPADVKELKGEIAYAGIARGAVKIVFSAKDMQKVAEGDILVSQSTDPSVLPAMKKAAAFVTDVGGLTCHAAIVAREMKKPCIVGVRIATRVLKDGDIVEVDAEKGIVNIIK